MAATPEERQAAIKELERLIKRAEDRGSKSVLLQNSKEHLRALRAGDYDRSFADIFVSGPGG
jgi:hypothetical protein|tara:strand:+ start:57 stop:242 length:186 start_codon:yes stop_codon:yes gene_type:complete